MKTKAILVALISACSACAPVRKLSSNLRIKQDLRESIPKRPHFVILELHDQDAFSRVWEAMPATKAMLGDAAEFKATFAQQRFCCQNPQATAAIKQIQEQSYYNMFIGKSWRNKAAERWDGFDVWHEFSGGDLYGGYQYQITSQIDDQPSATILGSEYSTDAIKNLAISAIEENLPSRRSLFLWLSPTAPHLPMPPASRHVNEARMKWSQFPERANFNEQDVSDKADWLKNQVLERSQAVAYVNEEYWRRMGSLRAVDEMMISIRESLEKKGRWENTILIVTSTSGYNLGSHRLIHKMAPYEESVRVPLWIGGPGIAGGAIDELVDLKDVLPTLVDLTGERPLANREAGLSFKNYLLKSTNASKVALHQEWIGAYKSGSFQPGYVPEGTSMESGFKLDVPSWKLVRTKQHKLIQWENGTEELYDLASDPNELQNRLAPTELSTETTELLNQLRERLARPEGNTTARQ